MINIDESIMEAIITISNDENFIKRIEPNVARHLNIERWMVNRVAKALMLLSVEWKIQVRGKKCSSTKNTKS
jgi:hypothetical protein